jgi:hypothetical protein
LVLPPKDKVKEQRMKVNQYRGKLAANVAGGGPAGAEKLLAAGPTNNGASMFLDVGGGTGGSGTGGSHSASRTGMTSGMSGMSNVRSIGTATSAMNTGILSHTGGNSRKISGNISRTSGSSSSGGSSNLTTAKLTTNLTSFKGPRRLSSFHSSLYSQNRTRNSNPTSSTANHNSDTITSFLRTGNPNNSNTPFSEPLLPNSSSSLSEPLLASTSLSRFSKPSSTSLSKFSTSFSTLMAKPIPALQFAQQHAHRNPRMMMYGDGNRGATVNGSDSSGDHHPHSAFLVIAPAGGVDMPKVVYESENVNWVVFFVE